MNIQVRVKTDQPDSEKRHPRTKFHESRVEHERAVEGPSQNSAGHEGKSGFLLMPEASSSIYRYIYKARMHDRPRERQCRDVI